MPLKNTVYQALNRPGGRPLLGAAASLLHSVVDRGMSRVTWNGDWVHRLPDRVLVERSIILTSAEGLDRNTRDHWFHTYTPRRGDTVLDVGAATGWETILLSRLVGPSGRVIAIEAHPQTFECLRRMVEINGLTNVTPLCCAVADAPGSLTIGNTDNYLGNSVLQSGPGLTVPARTLQEICETEGVSEVAFAKLNIEGAEYAAIRGLGTLASRVRHLIISCHDFLADWGQGDEFRTRHDILEWMAAHGFAVTERRSDGRPWVRDYVYGDRS